MANSRIDSLPSDLKEIAERLMAKKFPEDTEAEVVKTKEEVAESLGATFRDYSIYTARPYDYYRGTQVSADDADQRLLNVLDEAMRQFRDYIDPFNIVYHDTVPHAVHMRLNWRSITGRQVVTLLPMTDLRYIRDRTDVFSRMKFVHMLKEKAIQYTDAPVTFESAEMQRL